jgi:hypothetical protein
VPTLSPHKRAVLDALDEQIVDLQSQLAAYKPLVDELAQLQRARATLLGESARGRPGRRRMLDVEAVDDLMRTSKEPLTPVEMAAETGEGANAIRSHLHRYLGSHYRKEGQGWVLIGESD